MDAIGKHEPALGQRGKDGAFARLEWKFSNFVIAGELPMDTGRSDNRHTSRALPWHLAVAHLSYRFGDHAMWLTRSESALQLNEA
jgi:hypothetical protein